MHEEINSRIVLKKTTALLTVKGFKFNNVGLSLKRRKEISFIFTIMHLMHHTEKNRTAVQ